MSKGASSKGQGGNSGNGRNYPTGGERPANEFPGGNWPSKTGKPSGDRRGNALSSKTKLP